MKRDSGYGLEPLLVTKNLWHAPCFRKGNSLFYQVFESI